MKNKFIVLLAVFSFQTGFAQIEFSGSANLEGYYSQNENLPFWFYSNQRGRVSRETILNGFVNVELSYNFSENSNIKLGASLAFQNGVDDKVFLDEIYAEYNNEWLQIIAGRKQFVELYDGLSATNKNFLWSLNSRPLPGFQLRSFETIYINNNRKIGFDFSWNDYFLGDNRFVKNAQLHDKIFYLIWNINSNYKLKAGINHSAIWGGDSPVFGKQPDGFSDYLKVIAGREGGGNAVIGDQVNVLGSHIGVYEIYLTRYFENSKIELIYNHLFDDGSGSRFDNFPDGRYGIFYDAQKNDIWIKSFLYEFYYTKNQSQTIPHLYDNYFNNFMYASGWTYHNRVIGLPLFTTNYYEDYPLGEQTIRIGNNNIIAHHFGINGSLFNYLPYKLLTTFRKNYGHYRNVGVDSFEYYPSDDPRGLIKLEKNIVSTRLDVSIPNKYLELKLSLGGDFSKDSNNIGAGVSLSKQF